MAADASHPWCGGDACPLADISVRCLNACDALQKRRDHFGNVSAADWSRVFADIERELRVAVAASCVGCEHANFLLAGFGERYLIAATQAADSGLGLNGPPRWILEHEGDADSWAAGSQAVSTYMYNAMLSAMTTAAMEAYMWCAPPLHAVMSAADAQARLSAALEAATAAQAAATTREAVDAVLTDVVLDARGLHGAALRERVRASFVGAPSTDSPEDCHVAVSVVAGGSVVRLLMCLNAGGEGGVGTVASNFAETVDAIRVCDRGIWTLPDALPAPAGVRLLTPIILPILGGRPGSFLRPVAAVLGADAAWHRRVYAVAAHEAAWSHTRRL